MGNISKVKSKRKQDTKKLPVIVCRCEEVTEEDVRQAIQNGCHSLEEVKRTLRIGMGHCSGRGCLRIVARIIQETVGTPISAQRFPRSRPPLKPLPLGLLGAYKNEQQEC
uniref:(2Fe-2S)-binding protein n=1 Tax=candidate division WOR-3 bacterium TaxID=2052148 RepID=A0A7V3PUZ7_UNCW3